MRLSALVVVAILLSPASVLAQRGGGSHSGGGFSGSATSSSSHGSSSSAGSSRGSGIASSSSFSSNSVGSARSSSERSSSFSERSPKDPASTGLNIRPNLLKAPVSEKLEEQPEKKGFFSFLHHKKPEPVLATRTNPPFHCKKGQSCRIPIRPACQTGRVWNSSSCLQYDQYSWFDACRSLADQMAAERERMRLGGDPGASLRYRMMQNQYGQCVARYGAEPFSSYLFSDASLVPYF